MNQDYSQSDILDIAKILVGVLNEDALSIVQQKIVKLKKERDTYSLQKWQRIADALEILHIDRLNT